MLGQFPIDVKLFCNRFNNETQNYSKGVLVRVFLILYTDNTYEYKIKTPPINFLLDLSSKLLKLSYSRKKQKKNCILLIKLYIINAIINKNRPLKIKKKEFKKLVKRSDKQGYKIIEYNTEKNYYLYK